MTNKTVFASAVIVTMAIVGATVALAANMPMTGNMRMMNYGGAMHVQIPGVVGTVTAVNGTTLSVSSMRASSTIYTVDASTATVRKGNATSSVSSIAIGDTVMVRGTINGNSVTATMIFDGKMGAMMGHGFGRYASGTPSGTFPGFRYMASGTRPFGSSTGMFGNNGILGKVTATSGTTLYVTDKTNTMYSVNVSNALINVNHATSSIASIMIGDNVIVRGTVNDNLVTATNVMDLGVAPTSTNPQPAPMPNHKNFISSIGSFFENLFKF